MRRAAVLLVAVGLLVGLGGRAMADGTIILNSTSDFQTYVNNNTITGFNTGLVNPQNYAASAALNTAYPNQTYSVSSVSVSSQVNGLLATTAPPTSGQYASSWTYGYHIDPDLTNYTVNLSLYLPQVSANSTDSGINKITIAITSVAVVNNQDVYSSRVWGFDNTLTPGILAPDPTTHLEDFSLAAIMGSGAGGSNFFSQDPGFSIQNVSYVGIGFEGVLGADYPVDPSGGNTLWIGTHSLTVLSTPEPTSAAALACGLLGVGIFRASLRARFRRRK